MFKKIWLSCEPIQLILHWGAVDSSLPLEVLSGNRKFNFLPVILSFQNLQPWGHLSHKHQNVVMLPGEWVHKLISLVIGSWSFYHFSLFFFLKYALLTFWWFCCTLRGGCTEHQASNVITDSNIKWAYGQWQLWEKQGSCCFWRCRVRKTAPTWGILRTL